MGSGYGNDTSQGGDTSLFGHNTQTGNANNPVGQLWEGIFGKHGPTAPRLPQGFEWMGPLTQGVAQNAAGQIDYGASNAAQDSGTAASLGSLGLLGQVGSGTGPIGSTFGNSLSSLNEGMTTGYMPDLTAIDAILRPGLNRSFQSGAADLREQNALMGNLSSTGAGQQMTDFRSQLENGLNQNVASIYGNALPASMQARSGATSLAANLPGILQQTLLSSMSNLGLQGQQFPLQALQTATGALGGAPFSANQGSGGNAGIGSALGTIAAKG
jgi:hypothetical protein